MSDSSGNRKPDEPDGTEKADWTPLIVLGVILGAFILGLLILAGSLLLG